MSNRIEIRSEASGRRAAVWLRVGGHKFFGHAELPGLARDIAKDVGAATGWPIYDHIKEPTDPEGGA